MENKPETTVSKYLVDQQEVAVNIYVAEADQGNVEILVEQQIHQLPAEEQIRFQFEQFWFKKPTWQGVAECQMAATTGMSLFPNDAIFNRALLERYLLRTTFFDVRRDKDRMLNVDQMIGDGGLHPKIVNAIITAIRTRA